MTLRNGRYVVPVRAEARSKVKGIVHDASGSGQTLFVEPLVVVELGNAWREAQAAVDEEEGRILDELSSLVGANGTLLLETLGALAQFDFWAAKAHLAAELDGIRPEPADRPEIVLLSARHPGLTGRVVPIDLRLGDGYTALVITGPNTGGKTVALRTRRAAVPHAPGRPPRPGRGRLEAAGAARRVRGHRRRAVDRPVPVDVLGAPALDHPDRRARRPGDAGAARRAGRRHGPDRGVGARPGAPRPLHPLRRARRRDHPLRGDQGLRARDAGRPQRVGRVRPRVAHADLPPHDRPAGRQPGVRDRRAAGAAGGDRRRRPRPPHREPAGVRVDARVDPRAGGRDRRCRRAREARRGEGRGVDAGRRRGAASGAQGARRGRARRARRGGAAGRGPARGRRRDPPPPGARDRDRAGHRRRAVERGADARPAAGVRAARGATGTGSGRAPDVAPRGPRPEPERRLGGPDRGAGEGRHARDARGRRDARLGVGRRPRAGGGRG